MKKFPCLLVVMLVMAFVSMPVISAEPIGPPGFTVNRTVESAMVLSVVSRYAQVFKEFNAIGFDTFALSTFAYTSPSERLERFESNAPDYLLPALSNTFSVKHDPRDRFQALARDQCRGPV